MEQVVPAQQRIPHLTPRERQVLHLLCHEDCLLEKVMPDMLGMSAKTFHTHREHLYAKLRIHSRQELLMKAIRLGLVPCVCKRGQGG